MERLKQKAEPAGNIAFKTIKAFEKEKWVRLEDVKEAIQQLKQNYIVIEKEKIKHAGMRVCFSCPYFEECHSDWHCFRLFMEELLRKNEG